MKVLQVMAGDTHGGAENFFMRLTRALHKRGLKQHIVLKPHTLREQLLTQEGIPYSTAPFNRLIPRLTRSKIKSIAHKFSPHIIMSWMSRASSHCPSGPFVHVGRLGGYYDLKYYRRCDYLVGNTPDIVAYFKEKQWPSAFTQYLPNFVDSPQTQQKLSRSDYNTPENGPLLLTLGRLHQDKAFDRLIQALTLVPQAYLWIGGVGEEEQTLKSLAQRLGVCDRIRFVGWHETPSPLYNACDIFVCPSRIEPLGNVVIEAWAHQKPVVAAKSKGPEGLIRHGETGLLAELEDWQGLASQINDLIDSPNLSQKLSKLGYTEFIDKYTENKVVDQYLTFFDSIIGKKRDT